MTLFALVFMRQSLVAFGRIFAHFYVKVYSDPEVDSPFALGNLDKFFNEPFVSGTLCPRCVSLRRFGRISQFPHVKVDSASECDERSYGGDSSSELSAIFGSPRW